MIRDIASRAAAFWDANKEKANDPTYWAAHPLCRVAVNRRVTGSDEEEPLAWFRRLHAVAPFGRGVSFGCGMGSFERAVIAREIVSAIDAFEVSEMSLAEARRLSAAEGISKIRYEVGSFNRLNLPARAYDIAFFHASLHHVSSLEHLFRALARSLEPRGAIYIDEYVGPSRDRWRTRDLDRVNDIYRHLPPASRLVSEIPFPIEAGDPSEGIRSAEITAMFRAYFDRVEWRPYGGQILSVILPQLKADWLRSPEGEKAVSSMIEAEDAQLRKDPSSSYYLVAFGRLKERVPRGLFPVRRARFFYEHRLRPPVRNIVFRAVRKARKLLGG